MSEPVFFHLFVYGTLRSGGRRAALLEDCTHVRDATAAGTLYDISGEYPALLLYGDAPVHGEIRRCPAALLQQLDEYEGVHEGLFRRVGLEIDGIACWTYVAGPRLASRLTPDARLPGGDWLQPSAR